MTEESRVGGVVVDYDVCVSVYSYLTAQLGLWGYHGIQVVNLWQTHFTGRNCVNNYTICMYICI